MDTLQNSMFESEENKGTIESNISSLNTGTTSTLELPQQK